ncbi:GMC oxidoreductase [Flagellimonas sp. CMM7]|uniref:GMC oxidoreductase n=1 Tax=Flagellimonas sp. CMM7 TaxID=2654676 RepID=UPI0013D6220A|nr:GMC family oxidoreductase [Flagellimonas sp. CMM7]UII80326.1 GMC family oxidoreductase [Flagellimonas sp. CMM7]
MNSYDVIIIGTGAGGGTLAAKLAPTGKKILILERGDYVPREKENWDTEEVFVKARYKAKEPWIDSKGEEFHPGIHYCVGGNTKFYGAALLRMREKDFREVLHHGGVSPAWPISYQDLQPYYMEAEKMYHVHGERGSDPTEPLEHGPYPEPPLPHEPRIQELFNDIKELGLNPFPLPIGVKIPKGEGESPFVLDRFDGFPDPTESKADSHVMGIKKALEHPNVTLLVNAEVKKLLTNEQGSKITEVVTEVNGIEEQFTADTVVVACGAINSAALLLKSKNKAHPDGLANGSGVVGRNYMCHNNSAMVALSKKPNPTKFGKTFALNDFYFKGDEDFKRPMGHIQMLGKSDALMFKGDAPKLAPNFTLEMMAEHALDFWMTSEDLPDPDNRVVLTEDGNVQLLYKENNLEGHKKLQKKLKWILEHVGCQTHFLPNNVYLGKKIPLAGTAHQCGTVRFGKDPETSALDTYCKAHEVENLYVVDGSFFPSSSAVNPGLTIMAQALRVGDHLIKNVL